MKATLAIDVGSNWEKGKGESCSYCLRDCFGRKYCRFSYMNPIDRKDFEEKCTAESCPLEIQENKCSFTPINEDSIELKVDDIEPFATVGRIIVTSPDHWCRTYYDCVDCELYKDKE